MLMHCFIFSQMKGKGQLWKNIGKQDNLKSMQSSYSQSNRPKKALHIQFDDGDCSGSDNNSQDSWKKYKRISIKQQSQISNHQELASPMIMTMDMGDHKDFRQQEHQHESVLEMFSFDSNEEEKLKDLTHILKHVSSVKKDKQYEAILPPQPIQIDPKNTTSLEDRNEILESNISINKKTAWFGSKGKMQKIKMAEVADKLKVFKQEIQNYKLYILNVMSEWEVQAINDCSKMNQSIEGYFQEMHHKNRKKRQNGVKLAEKYSIKNNQLQMDIEEMKRQLIQQKQNKDSLKRQLIILQEKNKYADRSGEERRSKHDFEQSIINDMKLKLKKQDLQLSEMRLQNQSVSAKYNKLREMIKEKELAMARQSDEVREGEKKIRQLKIVIEEIGSKERSRDIQSKLQRQKYQKETAQLNNELNKQKQQTSKMRALLKSSEEQLSQCEQYIAIANKQTKELSETNTALTTKMKDTDLQYYKRLQQFDKCLIDLDNSIKEMGFNHQNREKQFAIKIRQMDRVKEEVMNRQADISNRQIEMEEMKKEFQHRIFMFQKREEGMRAEYKMAVQNQNATKQKWYQRYYSMFSPERPKQYRKNINYIRETPQNIPPRNYKKQFDIPVRQNRSPQHNILQKAKSQKNLSLFSRSDCPAASLRRIQSQMGRESSRQMSKLGSRISCLRHQLTKELDHIKYQ